MIRLALAILLMATPLAAEEDVVAGLSQDRIEITANFGGSDIIIYGAVKREDAIPSDSHLDVIVTVEGPHEPELVRRKERVFGLWINRDQVLVDEAPSFYAVATTGVFTRIISDTADLRYSVSIPRAIRSVGAPASIADSESFTEALIRLRQGKGLYSLNEGGVRLTEQTLFRADFDLPANLVEGNYKTRIFLLRDRKVVSLYEKTIFVRKVGLERWLFRLSREAPAAYGLLALVLAAAAGWGASTAFRLLRR